MNKDMKTKFKLTLYTVIIIIFIVIESASTSFPFKVYWNVPSENCGFLNVSAKWSMTANSGENFKGDRIVILYGNEFGKNPYYDRVTDAYVYGGIPQLGNWSDHVIKLRSDVKTFIPDEEFDGLAILDWEKWRPKWVAMWEDEEKYRPYRSLALKTAIKKHRKYADKPGVIEWLAAAEWERAANNWLKETLIQCKKMRPKAKWGYYHYPDCYQYKRNDCNKIAISANDNEHSWMWKSQDAYFPCGYHGFASIHSVVREIHRLQKRRRREIRIQRRKFHLLKIRRRKQRNLKINEERKKTTYEQKHKATKEQNEKTTNEQKNKATNEQKHKATNEQNEKTTNEQKNEATNEQKHKATNEQNEKTTNEQKNETVNQSNEQKRSRWRSFGHWDKEGKFYPRFGKVADKPWFLYLKFTSEPLNRNCYNFGSEFQFLDQRRLLRSMSFAWTQNAAGVILWDSSCFYNQRLHPAYCAQLRRYIDNVLGPVVQYLVQKKRK